MGRSGPLRWPTTRDRQEYMRQMKRKNRIRSRYNPNELWMWAKLRTTGLKWTRQAIWGYRIFDFWCAKKGIAVEVDGPEHNKQWDEVRDNWNRECGNIIVLRVRNMNEADAARALDIIAKTKQWWHRRDPNKKKKRGFAPSAGGTRTRTGWSGPGFTVS